MASVYTPDQYIFRCNQVPQPDVQKYYVAVWTRYNSSLVSQLMPKNCNQTLLVKSSMNGKSASAKVVDRCASCVGIHHQTSHPNTRYVNSATIDLSPALFRYLFNVENAVASGGVYDVEYSGPVYGGSWDGEPDPLDNPICV